jgi:hypothetical protein
VVQSLAIAALASSAHAATSFRIEQLFSTADGAHQYVMLRETAGRDGEHAIGGLVLRARGGGTTREYAIPTDLFRTNTANKTVVISTPFGVPTCCFQEYVVLEDASLRLMWFADMLTADYMTLPERFLSLDGGVVEIVGIDAG